MIRVVIIGGGFAGCELAKRLHDFFDVILIDSKNYFECTPAMPRALVDVGFIGNIHVHFTF
jgi:NADH dehydrogenase FAD-containing subunit